jgi:hypothetical protein
MLRKRKYPERMSISQKHRAIAAAILFLVSRNSKATQIVVVVANDGIVIVSDSKQVTNVGLGINPELANKVVVLNDRAAVAADGLGKLTGAAGNEILFSYSSEALLKDVKKSVSPNVSIAEIERTLVGKLNIAMTALAPYVSNGSFNQQNAPEGDLLDFILIGYDGAVPVVHKLRVTCDWNARKILDTIIETRNPLPNRPVDSNVIFFGRNLSIQNAADPNSPEGKAANMHYPGVIKGLDVFRHGKTVNSIDAMDIAADLIRLEVEFDSKNVGFPMNVVVLSRTHAPTYSRLER